MEVGCNKSAKGMKLAPSSSSCFITNLPVPILMEILCRLPIKTLIASKCVCKSWLNLSKDPHFTQLHQAKAPTVVCFQLYHDQDTMKLYMGNFHCLSNFDPRDVELNTLFEIPKLSLRLNNTPKYRAGTGYLNFSNSCNGLLCYHGGNPNRFVMVWNPCTSEFITIPTLAATHYCCYGFGFSRKANKYKLLRVVSQKSNENVVVEILTIEKGCSWNTLGPCPSDVKEVIHYCSSYKDPTFLHGTLHWLDIRDDILSFDFENEQFGRVPLPPSLGEERNFEMCEVGEFSGCLFITEYMGKGINIWLMKEYGVQDSWTKTYSLPCFVKGESIDDFRPVTCMNNGEILLACSTDSPKESSIVFSYDPDLEGFRCIGSGPDSLRVIAYRPSLVLLKDSMLGYKVHDIALEHREMSTTPDWWTLLTKREKRKGHARATSASSVLPNVFEPFKEQIEQLKQHNQHLEERLQDEKAKVKQQTQQNQQLEQRLRNEKTKVKQQIQQSEQLKQQSQQLEERLRNEHAKVKQLEEKLQQNEQLK